MKTEEFWKELITKIFLRIERDKLLYGDSYTEITYDSWGLIKNIKFDGTMLQDKVIVEGDCKQI